MSQLDAFKMGSESYLEVPEPEYLKMMTEDKAVASFLKPYVHPNATNFEGNFKIMTA